MSSIKRRKVDDRTFKEEWIPKFFFTQVGNRAVCLLCSESVAEFKKYNIERHYTTKHKDYGNDFLEW